MNVPADAINGDGGALPGWLEPFWSSTKRRWQISRQLVIQALKSAPELSGVFGLNQLSGNIEARRQLPWSTAKVGPVTGSVDLLLGLWLTEAYGLPSIGRGALMEAILTVAYDNPFHPVRDYLAGLRHDGTPRLDGWLIQVIGEEQGNLEPALSEYLGLVGRFWVLGMVYRVMEPGCKFDYCPVLEGAGGLGKSTMVAELAGRDYFSDAHFDLTRGKEGQEQVQGVWLYELAELASLGKSEVNLIKAFISASVDRYRPSYGRVVEAYPRQCVMVGTTNESTYLRDRTGNRRFWPVPVRRRIRLDWLTQNRDQLFAEAYQLYLQGTVYSPTPELEERLFFPMQEDRLIDTAVISELQHVVTRTPAPSGSAAEVNELTETVTMPQLVRALGVDAAKSTPGLESQIRAWLKHAGWKRARRQAGGVRVWCFERPKASGIQGVDDDASL